MGPGIYFTAKIWNKNKPALNGVNENFLIAQLVVKLTQVNIVRKF